MIIIGLVHRFHGSRNEKPKQTRSVSIGSDQFQTESNKVGYFFGLVRFGLSVSFVLSEPLTLLNVVKLR